MAEPEADDLEEQMAFAREFGPWYATAPTLTVEMSGLDAWVIVAQLQLACRHPDNVGASATIARRWASAVAAQLNLPAGLQALYESGWDPTEQREG